ncbi:hypothetical protein ABT112_23780 [Streptomyces sp. NPDC002055]
MIPPRARLRNLTLGLTRPAHAAAGDPIAPPGTAARPQQTFSGSGKAA